MDAVVSVPVNDVALRFPTLALPVTASVPVISNWGSLNLILPLEIIVFDPLLNNKALAAPGIIWTIGLENVKLPLPSFCKNPALPVILTLPTAPKLAIPLTFNPVNVPKLVILPCDAVITLPLKFPVIVPVAFIVPVTLTPVPVTTNILALPTALILTFPSALGIFTLLLPLVIVTPASKLVRLLPSPYRYCALIKPLLA